MLYPAVYYFLCIPTVLPVVLLVLAFREHHQRQLALGTVPAGPYDHAAGRPPGVKKAARLEFDWTEVLPRTTLVAMCWPWFVLATSAASFALSETLVGLAPIVFIAWWLQRRERGSTYAFAQPAAMWVLTAVLFLAPKIAIEALAEAGIGGIEPIQSFAWVGFVWPSWIPSAVLAASALATALALIWQRRTGPASAAVLTMACVASAITVWSALYFGPVYLIGATVVIGYATSRAVRQRQHPYRSLSSSPSQALRADPSNDKRQPAWRELWASDVGFRAAASAGALAIGLAAASARVAWELDSLGALGLICLGAIASAVAIAAATARWRTPEPTFTHRVAAIAPLLIMTLAAFTIILLRSLINHPDSVEWEPAAYGALIVYAIPALIALIGTYLSRYSASWDAFALALAAMPFWLYALALGDADGPAWAFVAAVVFAVMSVSALRLEPARPAAQVTDDASIDHDHPAHQFRLAGMRR